LHAAQRHKPTRADEAFAKPKRALKCHAKDVQLADDHAHARCLAGQRMYQSGGHRHVEGLQTLQDRGTRGAGGACLLRARCLRYPARTAVRQVAFLVGRVANTPEKYLDKMKRKIDRDVGRSAYRRRLGIIEPVFGNLRHTKRLNRFTLRGRRKVHTQWQRYCVVQNIEKLQRYGRLEERMNVRCRRTA
jgi:DDE family transposase